MTQEVSTTEQVYALIGACVGAEVDELAPELALKDDLNAAPEDFADLVEALENILVSLSTPSIDSVWGR